MTGLGDQPIHGTYDDVAAELRSGAKRLALPLAAQTRRRALSTQRNADATRRTTRNELTRHGEAELIRRQLQSRIDRNPHEPIARHGRL